MKVPSEERATQVFKQLFIDGTPDEVAREVERIKTGQSILDGVREQSRSLAGSLGPADRQRIDLMMTSIREAEQRLQQDQAWVLKPKPKVQTRPFTDDYHTDLRTLDRERQWFDLVHLALQTDSTRVIALWIWSHGRIDVPGVQIGHHDATHHGQDEAKIRQLAMIEEAEMALFAGLLGKMKDTDEDGSSLLDRTVVFYGSNMGNASAHTCENLPVLLAGGGFPAFRPRRLRPVRQPLSSLSSSACCTRWTSRPIASAAARARSVKMKPSSCFTCGLPPGRAISLFRWCKPTECQALRRRVTALQPSSCGNRDGVLLGS